MKFAWWTPSLVKQSPPKKFPDNIRWALDIRSVGWSEISHPKLTAATMSLYCRISRDIRVRIWKDGKEMISSCVPFVASRGVTVSRPSGWVEHHPGSILPAKHNLCIDGILLGQSDRHFPQGYLTVFPLQIQTSMAISLLLTN